MRRSFIRRFNEDENVTQVLHAEQIIIQIYSAIAWILEKILSDQLATEHF